MEVGQEQAFSWGCIPQGFGSAILLVPSSQVESDGEAQAGRDGTQPKSCPSPGCYGGSRSSTLFIFCNEDRRGGSSSVAGPQPKGGWTCPQPTTRAPAEQQVSREKPAHTDALHRDASRSPDPLPQTSGLIRACGTRTARMQLQTLRAATDLRRGRLGLISPPC